MSEAEYQRVLALEARTEALEARVEALERKIAPTTRIASPGALSVAGAAFAGDWVADAQGNLRFAPRFFVGGAGAQP